MLAAVALVLGLLVGWASRGDARNLASLKLRFQVPMLVLFLIQGVSRGRLPGLPHATVLPVTLWIASSVALCGLLAFNWRIPGMSLATVGILINLDVVLSNGAMPVAGQALSTLEQSRLQDALMASGGFYHIADSSTRLLYLSDVMLARAIGGATLFSVGDLVLAVAIVALIVWAMTANPLELGR